MRSDRVIKLPVFHVYFRPVARKEWKCTLCKQKVHVGERYVHYFDRRTHEILDYRFHPDCFTVVEAYCIEKRRTTFSPRSVIMWAKKGFCAKCQEECPSFPCAHLKSITGLLVKSRKKISS